MEGVIKTARQVGSLHLSRFLVSSYIWQYFFETNQKQRVNFIARQLSYHGNTLGALELCHHSARRVMYEPLLEHEHFHHVSPAYAKRFALKGESEDEYVERLRKELEDKFLELGPDTVIGCKLSL